MSYLFSRALVAEYLEANSLDGEQFAPSSGTPTPQAYLCNGKTTAAWKRFRSGMTSSPLTADRGEELLKWYRAGFPAPTSALPDEEQGLTDRQAPCGSTWHELSVRFDRNTSSWKTHRCLFNEVLQESSVTLPRWGMMHDGELWERTTLALRTEGTGRGSLATPTARDWKDCGTRNAPPSRPNHSAQTLGQQLGVKIGAAPQPGFAEWMLGWPIGWTDSKPLATAKFRQWCDSHGVCLEGQSDED